MRPHVGAARRGQLVIYCRALFLFLQFRANSAFHSQFHPLTFNLAPNQFDSLSLSLTISIQFLWLGQLNFRQAGSSQASIKGATGNSYQFLERTQRLPSISTELTRLNSRTKSSRTKHMLESSRCRTSLPLFSVRYSLFTIR